MLFVACLLPESVAVVVGPYGVVDECFGFSVVIVVLLLKHHHFDVSIERINGVFNRKTQGEPVFAMEANDS